MKKFIVGCVLSLIALFFVGCGSKPTSDDVQREEQERLLMEGSKQIGMPNIKNFRERKLMKDILELRDQEGLITYTYVHNEVARVVPGVTAKGGTLTYLGETIGYGLPAATQFTNPQKLERTYRKGGSDAYISGVIPQADPNGLFSPGSAEGTWVMMINPTTGKAQPQYVEPRIMVMTFQFPFDQEPTPSALKK